MQDQHTQEPWYASKEDGNWRVMAADENGGYTLADMYCDDPEANSRRIVACVNACAGIPTEELVRAKYLNTASYAMRQKAEKQCDKLLAALEQLVIVTAHLKPCPGTLKVAKDTIASVKEQA